MTRTALYSFFSAISVIAFFVYSVAFASPLFFEDVVALGGGGASAGLGNFFLAQSRWAVSFWNYITLSYSGLSIEAFRFQNFVLHVLIAWVLLLLLNFVFKQSPEKGWIFRRRRLLALSSSALFLLHPAQAQTALHVVHMRLEGLMVLCVLVVCYGMMRAIVSGERLERNGWFFASLALSVLAVGTKESIIVTPFLVLLLDWFFIARAQLDEINKRLVMYGIFFGFFYVVFFIINSQFSLLSLITGQMSVLSRPGNLVTSSYQQPLSAYPYFLTQIPLVFHYLSIFLNPFGLCVDYDVPMIFSWNNPIVVFSALAIVALVVGVVAAWYLKRSNLVSFGLIWFFIAIAPRVTLVPSADIVGDYKMFLASVGMLVLLSAVFLWVIDWVRLNTGLLDSKISKVVLGGAIVWLFVMLTSETRNQCVLWSDSVAFWEYVKIRTPGRARTVHNLGVALAGVGRVSEAMDCYHEAVVLDDQYAEPLVKLGECYQERGDTSRALSYYQRAESVETQPIVELHNNKGQLYVAQGDLLRAEEEFKKALAAQPHFSKALFNYANLLKKQGQFAQAYSVINECVKSSVHSADAAMLFLKARLAFEVRDFREVIATLEPRRETIGEDIALQFMLASSYYSMENYRKASELFDRVYSKRPDNLDVAYNYAQSLMKLERYSAAVPYFQQCSVAPEKYPFAPLHAATCLHRNGNHMAAKTALASLEQSFLSEPVQAELALVKRDMQLMA